MSADKEPGALRTIGEVAAELGVKQHVLRYWEQQFPMLRPLKRSGGRRYYRREDMELLSLINELINHHGYTLKGARQALESRKTSSPPAVSAAGQAAAASAAAPPATSETAPAGELLPRLRTIRNRLASALNA